MYAIRSLKLSDRPTVEAYLQRYPPEISELTFTNLFVWRTSRPVFIAEVEDSSVVESLKAAGKTIGFLTKRPIVEVLGTCAQCNAKRDE